ncbi:hypothetical protein [Streptomyces sp. NBC_01455]|uniref:hypothetical protein n=1 Tax=Streptomyces sp. NBC_01455 TaxID=2903874 RepID=UPI002E30B2AC|nr:hypothetical protein [Streptomyces sp. NBC_01455]
MNARYRNGRLVARADGGGLGVDDQPAGPERYRLVTTTERSEGYPYSTATRTEWAFTSGAPRSDDPQVLPLLQFDYGITTGTDGVAERDAALMVTASALLGDLVRGGAYRLRRGVVRRRSDLAASRAARRGAGSPGSAWTHRRRPATRPCASTRRTGAATR